MGTPPHEGPSCLFSVPQRARSGRAVLAIAGSVALVAGSSRHRQRRLTFDSSNNNSSKKLRAAVTVDKVVGHLTALDAIAEANGNTRASGTEGYSDSVDYIVSKLTAAGYTVHPDVPLPLFRRVFRPAASRRPPRTPPRTMPTTSPRWTSPSGRRSCGHPHHRHDRHGERHGTSGCEASDFAGFVPGSIALIHARLHLRGQGRQRRDRGRRRRRHLQHRSGASTPDLAAGTLGAPGVVGILVVGAGPPRQRADR
ncbi:MAG: hypothetical protein WKG07_06475 [Hymenobacter sp.]